MTLLKHMPNDAFHAMQEIQRCKDDPIIWQSMVLAILLERGELLERQASDRRWIITGWGLMAGSWLAWCVLIFKLMVRS
jgi:hypothetical protein